MTLKSMPKLMFQDKSHIWCISYLEVSSAVKQHLRNSGDTNCLFTQGIWCKKTIQSRRFRADTRKKKEKTKKPQTTTTSAIKAAFTLYILCKNYEYRYILIALQIKNQRFILMRCPWYVIVNIVCISTF